MNLSLIIFCYNESGNIAHVIKSAVDVLSRITVSYEIIIVNDGSTDATASEIDATIAILPNLKVIHHPVNLGIGMALRSGYAEAKMEFVCAIPGDGQFDVEELKAIDVFDKNVFYSFYRRDTNYSLYRTALSWSNRLFNQHILGIFLRDVNWVKVYRNEHLQLVKPVLKSSLIESEICAKLHRYSIHPIEIPSAYLPRNHGLTKGGNWKTLKKAIKELITLTIEVWKFKK